MSANDVRAKYNNTSILRNSNLHRECIGALTTQYMINLGSGSFCLGAETRNVDSTVAINIEPIEFVLRLKYLVYVNI